jgi:hypothetical protein
VRHEGREFNSVLDASATISRNLLVSLVGRLRNAEPDRPPQSPFSEKQRRVDLDRRLATKDRRRSTIAGPATDRGDR